MRPSAAPTLLAAMVATVPARLVKKLDASPGAADAWSWTTDGDVLVVTTDGGETVRLALAAGAVASLEGAKCTCLLSPRCFHLLAVVAGLPVGDAVEEPVPMATTEAAPVPETTAVTASERAAAGLAWTAASAFLAGGASAAGAVVQGELLRAAHAARTEGLHRLAGAITRAVIATRALRAAQPEFALGDLATEVDDLLATAHAFLHRETVDASHRGVARRSYEEIGGLRLVGLLTEPVIGRGYAGVVTYVTDDRGRIFTLNDVLPAEADRARSAYDAATKVGDTSVPHRALVREGLFMQDATASRDRRLGAGAKVKAVRAKATTLDDTLWQEPLATQITRAYGAFELPLADRPAAATLVFVRGVVEGREDAALLVRTEEGPLRIVAPTDHRELSYRDNLRLLAAAPRLALRFAGHVLPDRPRTLAGVAAFDAPAAEGAPRLTLPDAWGGRVCLGLDRMQSAHVAGASREPLVALDAPPVLDPLAPVRRRLERLALGGRGTLGAAALRSIEHERAALEKRQLATGSAVLHDLTGAALDRGRDLALAWLVASTYERIATRELRRAAWRL